MLSWIVLILMLVILGIVSIWAWGSLFGTDPVALERSDRERVLQSNRDAIAGGDIDSLVFEVVPRGYRQEQVDAAIGELHKQIESLRAEVKGASSSANGEEAQP